MGVSKSFLLLPHRIPAIEPLLGLTTTNPLSPLTSSTVPADNTSTTLTSIITPSSTLVTTEAPGALTFSVSKSLSFSVELEPFLSLESSRGKHEIYTITSRLIRKTRLKSPQVLFGKMLQDPVVKQELVRLLSKREPGALRRPKAYLVTGIVTAVDARIHKGGVRERAFDAMVSAPIDLIAGVPLPLPVNVGLGAGSGVGVARGTGVTSRSVGEEIWGVEYMEIRKKRWGADIGGLGRQVEKVRGARFFGRDDDDEDEDEDEDEDDDDDDEDDQDVSLVLGGGDDILTSEDRLVDFIAVPSG